MPIFFVISGFCIHLSHQRSNHKDFRIIFIRRFFRIYPPLFCRPTHLQFSPCPFWLVLRPDANWQHVLLIQNFYGQFTLQSQLNASFWSIAIEVQLYLLYPLLLFIVRRLSWTTALWMIGSIEVGLRIYLDPLRDSSPCSSVCYLYANDSGRHVRRSIFGLAGPWGLPQHRHLLWRGPLPFSEVPVWGFPSLKLVALLVEPWCRLVFCSPPFPQFLWRICAWPHRGTVVR